LISIEIKLPLLLIVQKDSLENISSLDSPEMIEFKEVIKNIMTLKNVKLCHQMPLLLKLVVD